MDDLRAVRNICSRLPPATESAFGAIQRLGYCHAMLPASLWPRRTQSQTTLTGPALTYPEDIRAHTANLDRADIITEAV